jgi:hypothetical protein
MECKRERVRVTRGNRGLDGSVIEGVVVGGWYKKAELGLCFRMMERNVQYTMDIMIQRSVGCCHYALR